MGGRLGQRGGRRLAIVRRQVCRLVDGCLSLSYCDFDAVVCLLVGVLGGRLFGYRP